MSLTKAEKLRINDQIDAGIPKALPFTSLQQAVVALLFAAESRWKNWDLNVWQTFGAEASEVASDISREALHWAIIWSYQKLQLLEEDCASIEGRDIQNAYDLLNVAAEYSELCDLMVGTFLSQVNVTQVNQSELAWSPTAEQLAFEAAQWLWRGVNNQSFADDEDPCCAFDIWRIEQKDNLQFDSGFVFKVPIAILKDIQAGLAPVAERRWQLPETVDLKLFTTAQFKKFWLALMTTAVPHRRVYAETGFLHCAVPIGSKMQWTSLLSSLSELKPEVITVIMNFLTYSIETTKKERNKRVADIISQPIFRLNDNLLALSTFMALGSSAERNLFDLLSNKMSVEYERIKDLKEEQWSQSLAKRFTGQGLYAVPQRKIPGNGGDIDLFIFDFSNDVCLVLQLKWFLVDRLKSTHLEQGRSAINQAKASVDWIRNSTQQASEVLKVPLKQLQAAKLLPLGIIKEGLLGGHLWNPDIPLISDDVFEHAITKFEGDLQKIWIYAHTKAFLPSLGQHYKVDRLAFVPASGRPFNGVRFQKPLIEKLSDWNP